MKDQLKYQQVLETLRGQIVKGAFSQNRRLPTRSQLGEQFGVGMATVQKALDVLAKDGFVSARPGLGTSVVEHAPHECRFGLLLPHSKYGGGSGLFNQAVRHAAELLDNGTSIQFRNYAISPDVQLQQDVNQLIDDVLCHRLTGLIFPHYLGNLRDTPAMRTPGIPRVCGQPLPAEIQGACQVGVDDGSFLDRAAQYLLSRGRKRVAHLQFQHPASPRCDEFEAMIRRRGLEVRPYWMQSIPLGSFVSPAMNLVHVLMELEGPKRPDALMIHDDHLLEPAIKGLLSAGVKAGEVDVVSLANFPSACPQGLPVRRLGFDWVQVIAHSIRAIWTWRQGKQPDPVLCPAVFEEELEAGEPFSDLTQAATREGRESAAS